MYNSQEIAQIIKKMAKERNITIKQLLEKCNLNINTISELSKGKQISYINFAIIADNLGCSVDYLLGRTEQSTGSTDTYIEENNNNIVQAHNDSDTMNTVTTREHSTDIMVQFLNAFNKLEIKDKIEVMSYTMQKLKKGA